MKEVYLIFYCYKFNNTVIHNDKWGLVLFDSISVFSNLETAINKIKELNNKYNPGKDISKEELTVKEEQITDNCYRYDYEDSEYKNKFGWNIIKLTNGNFIDKAFLDIWICVDDEESNGKDNSYFSIYDSYEVAVDDENDDMYVDVYLDDIKSIISDFGRVWEEYGEGPHILSIPIN